MFFIRSMYQNLEADLKMFRLEDDFKSDLRSPWVALIMLESKFYSSPAILLLSRVGVGKYQNKANSVSFLN